MIKWATVTATGVSWKVKFDGETLQSPKTYKKPIGYTPQINDRVCFLVSNGQYVCLGAFN